MRLIDADELCEGRVENDPVVIAVKCTPTIDAVPVVHGEWEKIPLNMAPDYFAYKYNLRKKCSACGYAMPQEWPNFNICPNCGAKMDGGEKNKDEKI